LHFQRLNSREPSFVRHLRALQTNTTTSKPQESVQSTAQRAHDTHHTLGQWFLTCSLKGAKFSLTTLLESRTQDILTRANWRLLVYCRTKPITQNIRGVVERLRRAAQMVLGNHMRLSKQWLRTTALDLCIVRSHHASQSPKNS